MKIARCVIIMSMLILLNFNGIAYAKKFTGEGSSLVFGNDKNKANEVAYQSALKNAVIAAVDNYFPMDSGEIKRFNENKAAVLQGPFPFITTEKVDQLDQEGNIVTVTMEVDIDEKELFVYLSDFGIVVARDDKYKNSNTSGFMVFVFEEIDGKMNNFPFSARLVHSRLSDQEYYVIPQQLSTKNRLHQQLIQDVWEGRVQTACVLGRQRKADFMVIGSARAVSVQADDDKGMMISADVILNFVRVDTEKILYSSSAHAEDFNQDLMSGARKAIETATQDAFSQLTNRGRSPIF